MNQLRNILKQALECGYLTVEAEEQLRQILADKYDPEDLENFLILQESLSTGKVKQQSRENFYYQQ